MIIYRQTEVDYIDIGGISRHLSATMPVQDELAMVQSFQNLPEFNNAYDYSDHTAEMKARIVYATRPLSSVSEVGGPYSYWPSPEDTRAELDQFAPPGMYDSVIIFWQASNPSTGQSIPSGGWGWGYWPGFSIANGMTYATVFNLSYMWTYDICEGEVFLHEWLHGVTHFYQFLGFPFPYEDLHGAEEAGYTQDANGCWETWLRDYMRGLVYENGQRTALVPETWGRGSITTYNIQNWRGEYYNNENAAGIPHVIRDDPSIHFHWYGNSPHPLINEDHFSAVWTRWEYFDSGYYDIAIFRDDGVRLWIDGIQYLDLWEYGYGWEYSKAKLAEGTHQIVFQTLELEGWSSAWLEWSRSGTGTGFCDGFSSGMANSGWNWIDPRSDSSYYVTLDGELIISTPVGGHDLFLNLNAPRLLQPVVGNFVIETEVSLHPEHEYQGAGLLIWQDSENYVRLELANDGEIGFIHRIDGNYSHSIVHLPTLREVRLRVQRDESQISAYYNVNGRWEPAGNVTYTNQGQQSVGMHIINEWQDNPFEAKFMYFTVDWCDARFNENHTKIFLPAITRP